MRDGRLKHFGPIASTGGLLDLVCDFIREMKRLEIWPDQLESACKGGTLQKDRELLAIYRAYQQRLLDHDLYDAEGRSWSARDLLNRQPIAYQLIVVDGFGDFTRTEHDILQDLAAHSLETWISLPMEGEGEMNDGGPCFGRSSRHDLFQKPLKTLAELWRRHANLREQGIARAPKPAWPAMDHLERTVFSNPRTMRPAPDTAGLEILAGGRQLGEIELIGRRIKRLLLEGVGAEGIERGGRHGTAGPLPSPLPEGEGDRIRAMAPLPDPLPEGEGDRSSDGPIREGDGDRTEAMAPLPSPLPEGEGHVRPGQIAVVFRNPQPVAGLVSEVFQRLEIPFFLESDRSLGSSPPIVMLLRLLELDADDWPMYKLLAVLGSNYFAPAWTDWNDRLAGRIERAIRGLQVPRGRERLLAQSSPDLRRILQQLADALDQLPRLDTLAAHALAWMRLADRVGIVRSIDGEDQAAWEQLQAALGESQRLAAWLGQGAPQLDRAQARETLLDILGAQTLRIAGDETGRVRVLSAASARHLRIPYLFLAGLTEKSFPAAEREDGVYSQAEHQRLIDAGLPLPSRHDRQTDEMLLFYETITAATRRLSLSYPSVDESGEPLTPSPFLDEVQQACGSEPIPRFEQVDLSPVPAPGEVCSIDAFRLRSVAEAVKGNAEPLAALVGWDQLGSTSAGPAWSARPLLGRSRPGQPVYRPSCSHPATPL